MREPWRLLAFLATASGVDVHPHHTVLAANKAFLAHKVPEHDFSQHGHVEDVSPPAGGEDHAPEHEEEPASHGVAPSEDHVLHEVHVEQGETMPFLLLLGLVGCFFVPFGWMAAKGPTPTPTPTPEPASAPAAAAKPSATAAPPKEPAQVPLPVPEPSKGSKPTSPPASPPRAGTEPLPVPETKPKAVPKVKTLTVDGAGDEPVNGLYRATVDGTMDGVPWYENDHGIMLFRTAVGYWLFTAQKGEKKLVELYRAVANGADLPPEKGWECKATATGSRTPQVHGAGPAPNLKVVIEN